MKTGGMIQKTSGMRTARWGIRGGGRLKKGGEGQQAGEVPHDDAG